MSEPFRIYTGNDTETNYERALRTGVIPPELEQPIDEFLSAIAGHFEKAGPECGRRPGDPQIVKDTRVASWMISRR